MKYIKRIAITLVLLIVGCTVGVVGATTIDPPQSSPIPVKLEKMQCNELREFYYNMAFLFKLSDMRQKAAETAPVREFWNGIHQFTIDIHPALYQAQTEKCKEA